MDILVDIFWTSIGNFLPSMARRASALLNIFYDFNRQQINIPFSINFTIFRCNVALNMTIVYQIQTENFTFDAHVRVANIGNLGVILPV
jgi:hypothetical protein